MTRRAALLAHLVLSISLIAGVAGAAPSAMAQTKLTATIPFAFSIGNRHLPAGSYSVERLSDTFIAVRGNTSSKAMVLMVRTEEGPAILSKGSLVFQRGQEGVYLTEAWFAGSSEHVRMVEKPSSRLEYAKGSSSTTAPVEVALK